jgi:hypothetical protein
MKDLRIFILVPVLFFVFAGIGYPGSLEDLESLSYIAWSEKPDTRPSGVVTYDKSKAFDGYNLYVDRGQTAYLMDMTGRVVHRWRLPSTRQFWEYARLLNDGDIVAASLGRGFVKLDKNSRLIWEAQISANHDIEVLQDGSFLVQATEPPVKYNQRCVFFDSIVHVSKDGKILDKWSTYEHFKDLQKLHFHSLLDKNKLAKDDHPAVFDWDSLNRRFSTFERDQSFAKTECYDYYHLNSIQVLPDTALGLKDGRFQKGNWLIGSWSADSIFILDKNTHQVVWSWGPGILDGPHIPRMSNNGDILVYDNGPHRSFSRLIIIDPMSDKIVWEYKANPPESFHSKFEGSSQLLPNGDFFICESWSGRAFEITPNGETVWEFRNPEVNKQGERRVISRMIRIPKEEVLGWLNQARKD